MGLSAISLPSSHPRPPAYTGRPSKARGGISGRHISSTLQRLPTTLLCLLLAATPQLALAQARPLLSLNSVLSLNTATLVSGKNSSFAIPQPSSGSLSGPSLAVSIALCSTSASTPRFFVSNASNADSQPDPSSSGVGSSAKDMWEIVLSQGVGSWTGLFPQGGILAIDIAGANGVDLDVGLSDSGPIHEIQSTLPLFGDTTANQALLFAAPFLALPNSLKQRPTYPNYTLPVANMSQPVLPSGSTVPNMTLVLSPTTEGLGQASVRSGCALLRSVSSSSQSSSSGSGLVGTGKVASQSVWARDDGQGWRTQWVVEGLTPATNHTAYVLTNGTKVSGPIYFVTKSAAFTCPLVHSLPYCPSVAYAIPLPAPSSGSSSDNTYNDAFAPLPTSVTDPLLSYIANFTTVLTTHACGRDWYSPLVGCDDCQRAYRAWLCSISFTRCAEGSSSSSSSSSNGNTNTNPSQQQPLPLPALLPSTSALISSRNPFLSALTPSSSSSSSYTAVLPCIEQCYQAERACPPFIGFKCPSTAFNAAESYAVGYLDSVDGDKGEGRTGAAVDVWGNVWCNLI